ncbi:hypothetical protein MHYP_G00200970 [Metynnis hypsauchen]
MQAEASRCLWRFSGICDDRTPIRNERERERGRKRERAGVHLDYSLLSLRPSLDYTHCKPDLGVPLLIFAF